MELNRENKTAAEISRYIVIQVRILNYIRLHKQGVLII